MRPISINLLGIERKDSQSGRSMPFDKGWMTAVLLIVIALALQFGGLFLIQGMKANAEEEIASLETEIKQLDAKLKEVKNLEKEKKNLQDEEKILLYVTGATYKWSYFLQELRGLMPLDLSINNLKINKDGKFTLTGRTFDHRTVALFIINLQSSKMISSAQLQSSKKAGTVTNFVITCQVKL